MNVKTVRDRFDLDTPFGWFWPLVIPFVIWFLLTGKVMAKYAFTGSSMDKGAVIRSAQAFESDVADFPGKPICIVRSTRNGNREMMLVARVTDGQDTVRDVLPFIGLGIPPLLLLPFGVCIAWKQSDGAHGIQVWRKRLETATMFVDILGLVLALGWQVLASIPPWLKI